MLKKRITAQVDKVIKIGSLEEDQVKELQALEALFPTNEQKAEEQKIDEEKPE